MIRTIVDGVIKIRQRCARQIILGFLRHGQEGLNKSKREEERQLEALLLRRYGHYLMPPAPACPWQLCRLLLSRACLRFTEKLIS